LSDDLSNRREEFITKYGWDRQVDPWLDELESMPLDLPNAYRIWKSGRRYLAAGHTERAYRCEVLIKLLHNSYIPMEVQLGEDVQFGYGGMGVIIHKLCEIGDGVVIGSNVTLGGSQKPTRISPVTGGRLSVPRIEDYAYIATGAKILGGVTIGSFAIVGANAVVTSDVPVGGIVAGIPAKLSRTLTAETVLAYKQTYLALRKLPDEEFLGKFNERANGLFDL
jgi:serine O-acetyltransferase